MAKRRISFKATKKVSKPVTVKFKTSTGKTVSFKAVRKISKPIRVTFRSRK